LDLCASPQVQEWVEPGSVVLVLVVVMVVVVVVDIVLVVELK